MRGFGGVLIAVAVLVAVFGGASAMFTPGAVGGLVFLSAFSAAAGIGAAGAALMALGEIRDAMLQLVALGHDDAAFRQAMWQRQSAPMPQPMPFPPIVPPSGEGQVAIPLPTRLELQDRHGADLGAAVFEIMQNVARQGGRISEESAVQVAQGKSARG